MLLEKKYFSESHVLEMFRGVCRGVFHMHSLQPRLAHRDIKIENVRVGDRNEVVLMDFGSTSPARVKISNRQEALRLQDKAAEQCTMYVSIVKFTISLNVVLRFYRAPELFDVSSNCTIDERTDVWVTFRSQIFVS
jgi:serine/threonine kinase 16